jgi:hypothetical protein
MSPNVTLNGRDRGGRRQARYPLAWQSNYPPPPLTAGDRRVRDQCELDGVQ